MKLRSLLMVGALLLGGCAVNPYGDACASGRAGQAGDQTRETRGRA